MNIFFDGPEAAGITVLLAHGDGAPMDLGTLTATAIALGGAGLRVARFEFDSMAGTRMGAGC
jgi:predicted alpha/beta-hydrolase family hydrolase